MNDFEKNLRTAIFTIAIAALVGWAGWLTTRTIDLCERIAVVSKDVSDLDGQVKVLFRRHN